MYRGCWSAAPAGATLTAVSSRLTQRRFVSMRDPHLAGLETTVVAGELVGPPRSPERPGRHREQQRCGSLPGPGYGPSVTPREGAEGGLMWLEVQTTQSHIRMATAARTRLFYAWPAARTGARNSQR